MSAANTPEAKTRARFPVCRKPTAAAHSPFCSQGCRHRDLLHLLGEGYRIAGRAPDPERMNMMLAKHAGRPCSRHDAPVHRCAPVVQLFALGLSTPGVRGSTPSQ